ncbi:vacuolar protein sorting-associated protein 13 [Lucilia cuprina]|uniref:vacuolar protein sorting-associated protein 13 n=1 Tax=Lucilia cuprina TaxID=7375 RepID=UPI001F06D65F|nr:vacuolar protein sorting-associated protein 13 [Lucilia cuprina]XP_023292595.2 vacuolar protein sorting-associated protein 13 [Lucilia cuprina]XP_023292597.2 vacuolar protein sorting-associated protein 13 [Lucilia cuprina]XP_046811116.1 vacuolar protein sorting-associated protein 13 [Lucilia cuprina]
MVLESVVAHYLNKYLFNYVENLDSNQLKISVWGGDIVLNNLRIRENALDDLDLPVQLVYGHLGKFVLQIPWKSIYSQPVVAHIEDLFLLVSPKQSVPYDAEKEQKLELEQKQIALKAIDEAFQKELVKDENKADPSYVEKLVARTINNIQVKIANVHIRYEDNSKIGRPFAFGITLNNFEIFTTDANWQKCFVDGVIRHVFKLASLDCLSVYMNCNADTYATRSENEIKELFRSNIASKTKTPSQYSFLLGPISSVAKLLLNSDPNRDSPPFTIPKTDLTLEMEKLNIGVTSTQFQLIVGLLDDMNQFQLAVPYRKYRPYNKSYKGNARIWWKFAIHSVLEEQVRKKNRSWTWEHIKEHRELCKTYAEAHKERCASKKPSATVEATCTIAEQKLDLFNLILIRKRVQLEVDRLRQGEELKKEAIAKSSWFGGWFGRGKKNEDERSDLEISIQAAMTPEEKRKLHQAIGYEDNMAPLELPEHYEAIHMKFTLKALEIGLYDDSELCKTYGRGSVDWHSLQTLMLIKLNMTTCTVKQRPAASAINVCVGMKELALTGLEQEGIAPTIIKSKISDENNLLDIFFETNPLDKQCDQRIKVTARPLEIVYDAETILKLMGVFVPQQQVNLSELEGAATLKISDFKERSATGMQYMIESHAIVEVDITFMPNILILPQGGKYRPGEQSLVVIGLGEFKISSAPHRNKSKDVVTMHQGGKDQDEILQMIMEKAYDRYNVSIENIQIMVSKPEDDWELCMRKLIISDMHLLRPTSVLVDAELCVVDDDPRLPKTKINILLPSINLNLTEDRVFEALRVAMSIPLPEKEKPAEQPKTNLLKSASQSTLMRSIPQFLNQDERRKTLSATAATSLTPEVVQYTSLEVHFALKEFSIALVRTSFDVDSPLSDDSADFNTPSQHSEESEFLDTRSSVSLTHQDSQKLLAFQVLQLEVYMAQRTFEMVAQAKLGAISLTSYETRDKKEEELVVIETPGFTTAGKSLLNVTFTAVDKSTPDFITKYKSIEQLARINFATLNVILHQENLLYIMEIANQLQRKVEKITASSKPVEIDQNKDRIASAGAADGFVDRLARIAEEAEITLERKTSISTTNASPTQTMTRRSRKTAQNIVESIKMKIEANLDQVGLELTCKKRSIASLKVNHLYAGVVLKTSYTEVQIGLKDILINDMNPLNIHSNILSIVGKDALKCDVVLYNLDETRNYNSDDMKINVEIGCMKIVFVNWFVNSVLSFMNNFQAAQQAIANAGAMAADAAKQNAVAVYEKATRMKLNVKIKAPVIIVPIDSKSLEAVALDLGQLTMSNVITDISTPGSDKGPAVMDEIKLMLKDMRLARVNILEESHLYQSQSLDSDSLDVVDSNFGFKSKVNILDPTSFTLVVKRNLSFSWYKNLPEMDISGRLRCIDLNLFMDDYALIMSILNRNMREGVNEFPTVVAEPPQKPRISPPKTPIDSPAKKAGDQFLEKMRAKVSHQEKISEQFKFNIQLDGVVLNLMTGVNEGLARFGLYVISLKGTKLMDETLTTNIVLCNMQLDDTRPSNTSEITKYLCRKDWFGSELEKHAQSSDMAYEAGEKSVKDSQYMLDITAVLKQNDTVANVRISSFDLILCVDFLLKLSEFFKTPDVEEYIEIAKEKPAEVIPSTQQQSTQLKSLATVATVAREAKESNEAVNKMNLTLVIDEPDIILVETLKDMNTSSIIFNMQAKLIYRAIGEKQLINGNIDGLKMYMCSFMPERREATRHYILHPCVINLHGSTPEEDGMHISLKTSEIIINISPATLELFNKAMQTINTAETDETKMLEAKNYSDIWTPKKYNEHDYWFLKAEPAEDALETLDAQQAVSTCGSVKTERCVIEIPSIMLVLEAGIGYYTTPLISMDTCLNAIANDWSSNLSVNGSLTLTMNYYNQSLAVWEPVIEKNEHIARDGERIFSPWELNFNLGIEKNPSEFEENKVDQTTTIKIHSEENLEMTVSKTFLDLIGTLGEAFGQAMDPNGLMKPDVIAPYVIENDTGFDINLNFASGIFTLHECHIPNSNGTSTLNGSIVFKNDLSCTVTADSIKCCTLSPGCKAYLQTKNLATIQNPDEEEYNIYVTVGHIQKQLVLPVSKSDKRYFSLFRDTNQDPWGIVSEVNSEYGTTSINIHSVVNIQNHFTTSIKVLRMNAKTKEMILVGAVEPGKVYHVPLHAIYSEGKYLHFAIEDYHTSVQGIKWDDCPTDMNYMRHLQCDPIETFEPFFINVSREKTEIYHEHSNKFKLMSAYYTLHLRPPVYLRNALPINITVSVAGCSVRETVSNLAVQTEESFTSTPETDTDSKKPLHQSDHSFVKEDLLDYGEKDIEAGSVLHLPTVKLAGRSKDSKSYLVIRMIQYLERDWSCTTEISENHPDVTNWKFNSYDSDAKMSMDLCVMFEDRNGSLLITLFSPFWLINKTGEMLSYKTDSETVEVLYHPPEYNGPILFSLRDKYLFDKKSCSIRVENGEWSNKIPLDVAGSTGSVGCKANDKTYQIGVHNHLTQNSLTKQITFIPYYTITNKCSYVIEIQESSRPGDPWTKLLPNGCFPLWPKNDSDHMMVARVDGQRTVPFKYSEPICNLLQLNTNKNGGINVDVQTTEGGIYITFTEYNPGDAPGLLINHTRKPIYYHEKGVDNKMVLQQRQQVLYTWSNPAGDRLLVFGENSLESDLRRDGIGNLTLEDNTKVYWVSFLDGLQRVILFTECEEIVTKSETSTALQSITQSIEVKIHGIGLSLINNETGVDILYLGITSSGVIWEYKKENKKRFKQLSLHDTALMEALYQEYLVDKGVHGVTDKCYMLEGKHQINFDSLKMVKNNVTRDIKRYFQPGVWIALNSSPFQSQIHAKINRIQLDNQLTDCIFPVVLAPIPPPKTLAKTIHFKPIIEVSIVERVVPHSNVKQYKYAKMLMQEFHFKVDLVFLMAIAELFTNTVDDEREAKLFKDDVDTIVRPLSDLVQIQSQQQQKNFYDNLHLGPMKVHVSFSMAGVDTSVLPGILSKLVQGVGVTLTDVNDVVIRLAFFEREYRFFTQEQLISEITSHYTGQALKQIYVLVLGLDVLGNPYGLVIGIKKGVEDLFYEPFQGAIQGPGEFAEGLVLGVKSLVGHTVGGAAGAVSKITGAMGKGLAVLTFDEEYQKKRRQNMNAKPKTFQEGMARSGKGLVMGFVDGVTGCVTKPISGAKEEGVEGFFKGLGKGTIGLVTRPTAGIVDFAHGTFDSVKRATELQSETRRLRPPRFIHEDKILREYCLDEAKGNQLLKEIDKGKYASTDNFVHCEEIITKQEYVVVSNHRIIYVTRNDMFGSWSVQWTYLWSEIERVSSSDRGVEILLKKEGKKVLGLFNSSEQQHKLIMMPLKKRREKLLEAIESHRNIS